MKTISELESEILAKLRASIEAFDYTSGEAQWSASNRAEYLKMFLRELSDTALEQEKRIPTHEYSRSSNKA